jgi:hypothetical protein
MWLAAIPKLLPVITLAVGLVERLAGGKKGKDKQDEAVNVTTQLGAILGGLDLELLLDPEVQKAIRDVIDAVVKIQNAARDARARRAAA